jgi:hypothetical protein
MSHHLHFNKFFSWTIFILKRISTVFINVCPIKERNINFDILCKIINELLLDLAY